MSDVVLVLGFYDRKNIGDECYKVVFRKVLTTPRVVFVCMDDATQDTVTAIKPKYVVIGGGDIVNDYFMEKARTVLRGYKGCVYGLSIGCPYTSCLKHLDIFDHVFARSGQDAALAESRIGCNNVTRVFDLSTQLYGLTSSRYAKIPLGVLRIGICLAQPVFYRNQHAPRIMQDLIRTCIDIQYYVTNTLASKNIMKSIEWHLIPFNCSRSSKLESDWEAINLFLQLSRHVEPELSGVRMVDPDMLEAKTGALLSLGEALYEYVSNEVDMMVCMRYHSVMFSLVSGTPFVALYGSTKINNCLKDMTCINDVGVSLVTDDTTNLPMSFDIEDLLGKCKRIIDKFNLQTEIGKERQMILQSTGRQDVQVIQDIFDHMKRKTEFTYRTDILNARFDDIVDTCAEALGKLCKMSKEDVLSLLHANDVHWVDILTRGVDAAETSVDAEALADEMATTVCYAVTKSLNNPCVWGLREAILHGPICLRDSLGYIRQHHMERPDNVLVPIIPHVEQCLVSIDPHIDMSLRSLMEVHRFGWGGAVKAMLSLDPRVYGWQPSDIFIDSFVDRSFHWSCKTLELFGVLPYKTPWYGFIHHTFDTTHSEYNCVNLLRNPMFIESLKACKGLIVLTEYLAERLRHSFTEQDIVNHPPVYVIYHPMTTPDTTLLFDMNKFIQNTDRSIVQIGAWMREPYAFFKTDVSIVKYTLQKKVLKGINMDLNFPPQGYTSFIESIPSNACLDRILENSNSMCRDNVNRHNKFLSGMSVMLLQHHASVKVIEHLSNDEYDLLLTENMVFLYLVDCSAVNTVLECIVRNTPLIVNRHPALEEVLGPAYPGFYEDVKYAFECCDTMEKVYAMHVYIKKLDKSRYDVRHFVTRLQHIIQQNQSVLTPDYKLYTDVVHKTAILSSKFGNGNDIRRFLPRRFNAL